MAARLPQQLNRRRAPLGSLSSPSLPWRRPRTVRGCRLIAVTARPVSTADSPSSRTASPHNWNQFISKQPHDAPETQPAPSSTSTFTLAVKDNIATLGGAGSTTCASQMLQGYASPFEATVVRQLRARGGVIVGKTNLDEFGMGSHSLNSHWGGVHAEETSETGHPVPVSVGGSSGGSAVAVRLGDADVALGTDTGGSVRLPAAYGGIVGFKPSYGMLSRFGVVPYANSLDTVGLLARDVAPIQRLIVGGEGEGRISSGLWSEADNQQDPTSLTRASRLRMASSRRGYKGERAITGETPLAGVSFGIPVEYNIAELDPSIRAAWTTAATRLRSLGATVAPVSLPSTRHALSAYYVLAPAEAASNLSRYDGVRYGNPGVGANDAKAGKPSGEKGTPETASETVLYERVRGAAFGREVQQRILLGAYALSSAAMDNYFLQAQRVRRLVVRDFDAVFKLANPLRDVDETDMEATEGAVDLSDLPEGLPLANKRGPAQVDFLLCPTAPTAAPRVADITSASSPVDAYMNDVFTVPASLAGLPAINVPVPPAATSTETTAFCPGLQLIGQFWDDARLLQVANVLMEASFARAQDKEALQRHRETGVVEA